MQQSIRKFPFFDFQAPTKQVEKVNVQKNDDRTKRKMFFMFAKQKAYLAYGKGREVG